MHTNGQTDTTKLTVTLRNFANAPINPCGLPKKDTVSGLYMDLYSAAYSVVLQLTAFI
jgi:hypothetical protein